MATLYVTHPIFREHLVPPGHPERPDRLRAIEEALAAPRFAGLDRRLAVPASEAAIVAAHSEAYVEAVREAAPSEGLARIESDTCMSPKSFEAAVHAAGAACLAVDAVFAREVRNAFVAARPPGHHAEPEVAMGFCLFNNAAIAARHAQRQHGIERVAIVDWDVHHGNGTQAIVWSDPSIFYASTHQMPLYPGTGSPTETGAGNILNAPLEAGAGGIEFREAFDAMILPALTVFAPDLVIISAGFDAHWRDPLANINLKEEDFAWATTALMEIAEQSAGGRIVSVLEGGYDLKGLADSAAAHVAALMEA